MIEKITSLVNQSIETKQALLTPSLLSQIEGVVQLFINTFNKGNAVFFCGNGGSASDALHIAAELSGRFYLDRKPLPAITLGNNISALTAISNDYAFDEAYARLLESEGKPGDVLVAISTSGNSANIVNAVKQAKKMNISTVGLTGKMGGSLANEVDSLLNVPSKITPRIQESHILIGHIICELVEKELFGK